MAKATSDPIAEILAGIKSPASTAWHKRVAPEHVQTVADIYAAYHAGKFGKRKRPACEAISAWLKENGIATVGRNGVYAWLENIT